MHHPKPKSAPARLKSKFVKNRTNAMKEIEAWVRKDKDSFAVPEASRMSGQLSDNVTEERMLKAKLWELSKERYKFLSQNTYEKKVFQDRQQRKAGLRRIASASADGRHRLASVEDVHCSDGRRTSLGLAPLKNKPKNARLALLDRLDPTKGKSSSKSVEAKKVDKSTTDKSDSTARLDLSNKSEIKKDKSEDSQRQKIPLVKFSSRATKDDGGTPTAETIPPLIRASSLIDDVFEKSKKTSEERPPFPHLPLSPHSSKSTPGDKTVDKSLNKPGVSGGPASTSATTAAAELKPQGNVQGAPTSRVTSASSSDSRPSWMRRMEQGEQLRYGRRLDSSTKDPRYASLERTLCPLVRSKTTGDITSIVSNIESLHVRPKKRPADAKKSKIELKAFEFMKEKGFAF